MASVYFSSTAATAAGTLLLQLLYLLGSFIYNVYFHPLRNYPGPKLSAGTKFPYAWARIRGEVPAHVAALHARYGPVVRVSPRELSYITAEAWRDIYGHKIGGRGGLEKDLSFYGPDTVGSNSIIRTNDTDHARQRRLLAHAFSDRALRDQEPLIQRYVDLLSEKMGEIAKTADATLDMVRYLNCCTFDIMGDLAFGEPLGLLEKSDYTPWVAAVFGTIKTNNIRNTITLNFPLFSTLLKKIFVTENMKERNRIHAQHSIERVDRRLARKTERPDIWGFVLRHQHGADPKANMSMTLPEMHANGSTLMIAGTETTATLLSGLTYHLLLNPPVYAKLTNEIRSAFCHPDKMNMSALASLPYLCACIEEALRIYPPVPVGLPRVVPPGGRIVCGKHVPGGTSVMVSQWAAYHSPLNFHEPDKFIPERWLEDRFTREEKTLLQPFSFGPRNCLGKNLAYHEMRLIAANVLWRFDLQLREESRDWVRQKVYTLWEKPRLMCKVVPREVGGLVD
ncbi:cytochrome P450 [Phyllosticta citribraziliensis]|uniref:Cytochrome P450 n=1 Tax=Phyllosticta citribraziliensis TaxID=989973 RepID=A0ABR1LG76_9PEZI